MTKSFLLFKSEPDPDSHEAVYAVLLISLSVSDHSHFCRNLNALILGASS